jgi:hypothetical protein
MEPLNYNSITSFNKTVVEPELPTKTPVIFNFSNWKIRNQTRRNGSNMRLIINLDKDQSLAFKNFSKIVKPEEVSDDDFIKTIFLTGVETMNEKLTQLIQRYALENKADLEASGISVIEGDNGDVTLAETPKE